MIEVPFDQVASEYDRQFTDSEVGRLQRALVLDYLEGVLQEDMRVLELNCGTGEDARWMAPRVGSVLATDLSREMVRVTQEKGLGQANLQAEVLDLREVNGLYPASFDLVFSNFGGLNCISPGAFCQVASDLGELVPVGGHFVGVIMPRACHWETLYFLAKGKFREGFRRRQAGPVSAALGGGQFVDTWYYNPQAVADWFGEGWRLLGLRPIGYFIPPSFMEPFFQQRPHWLRKLAAWDQKGKEHSKRARFSDHFLIHLQRTS